MSWLARKSAQYPLAVPLNAEASALWVPAQEGEGVANVWSGSGAITTRSGSPTWAQGLVGKCLTFDAAAATKQYWITNVAREAGDFGFYMLCKPVASAEASMYVIDTSATTNSRFALRVSTSTGEALVAIYDTAAASKSVTGTKDLRDKWTLLGCSVDSTAKAISLYADGEYLTSAALAGTLATNNNPINLFRSISDTNYFNGGLSHVFAAKRQITEAEFRATAQRMGVA